MNGAGNPGRRRAILSTSWIFVTLNYLYADVLILLGGIGPSTPEEAERVASLSSPDMLLVAAVYLEMAMVMAVLSRILPHGMARWTNVVVAAVHILGGVASLFVVTHPVFYTFFVAVEVTGLLFIIGYAWTWREPEPAGSASLA